MVMSPFIPSKIKKCMKQHYIYRHNIEESPIKLTVFTKQQELPRNIKEQIQEMVTLMQKVIDLKPAHRDISIKYYPTKFKKKLPCDNTNFRTKHVNTGVTTSYKNSIKRDIIIFRYEEAPKVLVHELLHAYDFHCVFHGTFQDTHGHGIPLEKNQKYDEALVETWATLIVHPDSLNIQIDFSMAQTAKILSHYGYTSVESFLYNKNSKNPNNPNNPNTLKTRRKRSDHLTMKKTRDTQLLLAIPSIFPYYILKSAFLFQYEKFQKDFSLDKMRECSRYTWRDFYPYLENKEWIHKVNKYMTSLPTKYKDTMCMTFTPRVSQNH